MAVKAEEGKVRRRKHRQEFGIVASVAEAYGVKIPPEQLEQSLTPNQVGEIMGLSGEAVKQWIYHRRLPAVKLANGYWKVRKSDLERFLQARLEGAKYRVMLVGGDAETQKLLNQELDTRKYYVVATDLLADAVLKIGDIQPSLIVVDVTWEHGWELIERIHANKNSRPIPVLILAGPMGTPDVERAAELDVKGCLNKPVTGPALAQQIINIQNRCL